MAKLKGPLFSLGASGQIAKALVYFPWKGLDVVRQHVVPANPNTAPQVTQRGYLTDAVDAVHDAQAAALGPLDADDVTAYAQYAATLAGVMTWFNAAIRNFVNQRVAALSGCVFHQGSTEEGVDQLVFNIRFTEDADAVGAVTAGTFFYGTSPTALVNSVAAVIVGQTASVTVAGLTTGQKYYWQFRPTAAAEFVGARSGIYHGTPD